MDVRNRDALQFRGRLPGGREFSDKTMIIGISTYNRTGLRETVDRLDIGFYYDCVVGTVIAVIEALVIVVLSKTRIIHNVKYFSLSFLTSDALFHLVSAIASGIKFLPLNDERFVLKYVRLFVQEAMLCISASSVVIMTLDRVIAVRWPMRYRVQRSTGKIVTAIVCTWMVNLLLYLSFIIWFALECSHLAQTACKLGPMKMSLSEKAHMLLTVMLTSWEVLNIIASCALLYLIQHYARTRNHTLFQTTKRSHVEKMVPDGSTMGNSRKPMEAMVSPKKTGQVNFSQKRSHPVLILYNHMRTRTSSLTNGVNISDKAQANQVKTKSSPLKTDSDYSDKTHYPSQGLPGVSKGTIRAAKVVLTVALTQLAFQLPYITRLQFKLFNIDRWVTQRDASVLETVSRGLLQLSTIPALHLYVFKLRGCREVIKKLVQSCVII